MTNPHATSERLRRLTAEITLLLPELVALARDLDRLSPEETVGAVSLGEAADRLVRGLKRH